MTNEIIDRDPQEILTFAREANNYYETTNTLLNVSSSVVLQCLDELDKKSRKLGEKYSEQVKVIVKQLESYKEFSSQLEKKANDLLEVYSERFF